MSDQKTPPGSNGDQKPGSGDSKDDAKAKMDELSTRVQDLESRLVNQIERGNRAEKLLQTYMESSPTPTPPKHDDPYAGGGIDISKLISDPDTYTKQVVEVATRNALKVMESRYREAQELQNRAIEIRNRFYADNPDLSGFEDIVGQTESAIRLRMPNTPYKQLLPEIAKAARRRVVEIKERAVGSPGSNPPNLGSPDSSREKSEPPPAAPETDDPNDYLADRRKASSVKRV